MSEENRIVPYPGAQGRQKSGTDRPDGSPDQPKKTADRPKSGAGGSGESKPQWKKKAWQKGQAKKAAPAKGGAPAKQAPDTGSPAKAGGGQPAPAGAGAGSSNPAAATPAGQPSGGQTDKPAPASGQAGAGAQPKPAAPGPAGQPPKPAGAPGPGTPQKPAAPAGGQGNQPNPQAPGGPKVVEVRPLAKKAGFRRRHWGMLLSFLLMVALPLGVAAWYLYEVSLDRYGSTTGFTVRQEEMGGASDFLGGLAQFAGSGGSSDSDILYEFIQSQEMVEAINAEFALNELYSEHWSEDPVFSLWPDASIEDLVWFWQRVVRTSYDQSSGLIEIRVIAPEALTAQTLARAIVAESQEKINELNEAARADAMRYAQADLEEALVRLKDARGALSAFRTRTQIIDPSADIQGQMGVVNSLQQQLAEALVEYDLLRDSTSSSDPRVVQVQKRIEAIRERIAEERASFANSEVGGVGRDYPTLMSEYEGLTVDREYAEESYRAALTALDVARAKAARQSRYLATYIQPTLPQEAEFPQREMILGLGALFLFLAWGIVSLIYYSLRDRR